LLAENESKPTEPRGKDERAETLVPFSVRLRSDQITFLKGLPNASLWLRKIIDDSRVREPATATGNRVILLTQQIKDVEKQLSSFQENPAFLEAKRELSVIHRENERIESDIKRHESWLRDEDSQPGPFHDLERFTTSKGELETNISKYKEWLNKGLEAEAKPKAIIAGFEQEIQKLESKRQGLEAQLLQEDRVAQQADGGSGGNSESP
jgi:chromosome segregation ATPase